MVFYATFNNILVSKILEKKTKNVLENGSWIRAQNIAMKQLLLLSKLTVSNSVVPMFYADLSKMSHKKSVGSRFAASGLSFVYKCSNLQQD